MLPSVDAICSIGDDIPVADISNWLRESEQRQWIAIADHLPAALQEHPQVHFFLYESPLQREHLAKRVAWQAVFQSLAVMGPDEWREAIETCHQAAQLLLSEVADFGVQALANAQKNGRAAWRDLFSLKDAFAGIPAIVCGAGPSLQEQEAVLGGLRSKALILAAGTAGASLMIEPHAICAIDKEGPPRYTSFQRPLFAQGRVNPAWIEEMQGEKVWAPESGPLRWEEAWSDSRAPFSCGWTVGNFATQIALWLGCRPIIWMGMDLCYREGRKYANVEGGEAAPLLEAKNRNGETIWTQRDWVMAGRWMEEIAREHPEIRFIQTSTEGLPLRHPIETRAFLETELAEIYDLEGRLHQALQMAPMLAPLKIDAWQESAERCRLACANFSLPQEEEVVYETYLAPLWQIWEPIFSREAKGQDLELHRLLFFQQVLGSVCMN